MKVCLAIIGIWSTTLCAFSAWLALAANQQWFVTTPFLAMSGLAAVLAFAGIRSPHHKRLLFWLSAPLCGLLYVPCMFAMCAWRGGESVAGWSWQGGLGIGVLLSALFGLSLSGVVAIKYRASPETGASLNGGPAKPPVNSV